jgi:hypothetical protein
MCQRTGVACVHTRLRHLLLVYLLKFSHIRPRPWSLTIVLCVFAFYNPVSCPAVRLRLDHFARTEATHKSLSLNISYANDHTIWGFAIQGIILKQGKHM